MNQADLELVIGQSGELRILRDCLKCNQPRLFNRIGQTPDKNNWVYICERCDNKYYAPIALKDRT